MKFLTGACSESACQDSHQCTCRQPGRGDCDSTLPGAMPVPSPVNSSLVVFLLLFFFWRCPPEEDGSKHISLIVYISLTVHISLVVQQPLIHFPHFWSLHLEVRSAEYLFSGWSDIFYIVSQPLKTVNKADLDSLPWFHRLLMQLCKDKHPQKTNFRTLEKNVSEKV